MEKAHLSPQRLAPLLWFLAAAFVVRVAGQMLVAFGQVTWLPAMSEWMSGLMPYPYLLPSQFVIIAVCLKVCLDFTRGRGWFVESRPLFARGVLYFGYVYFGGMIVRYIVQMIVRPENALVRRYDSDRVPSRAGHISDCLWAVAPWRACRRVDATASAGCPAARSGRRNHFDRGIGQEERSVGFDGPTAEAAG